MAFQYPRRSSVKFRFYTKLITITLITTTLICQAQTREPHRKQENNYSSIDTTNDIKPQTYRPNPVILNGVGQIMNGAMSIAQNPHNRPNLGHSIISMIHGILSIIVEKIAQKKLDRANAKKIEASVKKLCIELSNEINNMIPAE